MGLFLSFLGGAAERFSETLQESEKTAKAEAALRTKALYENYGKVVESNRKLQSELKADISFLKGLNPNISEDQVSALVFNRPVMSMLKKKIEAGEVNPATLDFATLTGITEQNENPIAAMERVDAFTKLPKATASVETAMPKGFFENVAARQRRDAETQMTAALGVSMEELRGAQGFTPTMPEVGGRVNLEQLMKKPEEPKSVDDLIKRQELARVQAGQRFGKDSEEYKAAEAALNEIKSYVTQTDRSLEVRLDRLSVAAMDEKDPARKKDLQRQIKETQQAIKLNKDATAAKSDEEKKKTYTGIRTSVNDYVNNRMREEEGASWRQYVEYSTMQLPDGSTYTGKTMKKMPVEAQQAMFARERQLTEEALRANGYVAANGMPRYPAVAEIMRNMNIPIGQQQTVTAPAPTPAPAAQATQQRGAAPTKTVKRAQVEAVARNKNITFEAAAAAARAEGYTITE